MKNTTNHALYGLLTLISFITTPLYLLTLWALGNKGSLKHRLGIVASLKDSIWLHGASLGEINSMRSLITQLHTKHPNTPLFITSNTQSGVGAIINDYPFAHAAFIPLDTPLTMHLALNRVQPHTIIVAEAERWTHLFKCAAGRGVTVIAYNARIRPSQAGSRIKRMLYKATYQYCSKILSQDPEPFKHLGLPESVVIQAMGSPKAPSVLMKRSSVTKQTTFKPTNPVLLVGSVHPSEIPYYIELFKQLKEKDVHLLLVARHPQTASLLRSATAELDTTVTHFDSQNSATPERVRTELPQLLNQPGITTVSIVGVLYDLYQYASLFYLGGTFNDIGGHNVLEPASWNLPVISGPNISETNYEALALQKTGGLEVARTTDELVALTLTYLTNTDKQTEKGNQNWHWLETQADQCNDFSL